MIEKTLHCFESDCGSARVFVEVAAMPIGIFHDFLMKLKGTMVDRMVKAQQEQEQEAAMHLAQELPQETTEQKTEENLPCTDESCTPLGE